IPLLLLWSGRRPLAPLHRLARRGDGIMHRLAVLARSTEDQLLVFFADHPGRFVLGVVFSLSIEALVIVEYEALLRAFAIDLPLPVILVSLVFSGLSRVVPTPGGIGALEASQVTALTIAGQAGAVGFLVGLLMRVHETLF